MLFDGFNESVNIVLPVEAKKAQPFPIGISVSTEAVPVVLAVNETKLNETMPENIALANTSA